MRAFRRITISSFLISAFLAIPALATERQSPHSIDPAWLGKVARDIVESEYEFRAVGDGSWVAANRAQGLRTVVTPEGFGVRPRTGDADWMMRLTLAGFGREGEIAATGLASIRQAGAPARVSLERDGLVEWLVNDKRGLEHGFLVRSAPRSTDPSAPLILDLEFSGLDRAEVDPDGNAVTFRGPDEASAVRYAKLHAFDAEGRALESSMRVIDRRLRIEVRDTDAVYPVTIDPLITLPDWSNESGSPFSEYGSALAAGDITGNGLDDVVVGAERYDDGLLEVGRVYVYKSLPGVGISTIPDWVITGDQDDGRFGESVAVANWNADTYDDLIIGASEYDDGTPEHVDEGWVFAYPSISGSLGNNVLFPFHALWTAQGDDADSRFGRSVAIAENLNGDIYGDLIVGAPDADGDKSFEGKAFIYYGSTNGLFNDGVIGSGSQTCVADGTCAWVAEGNETNTFFGSDVAAGDVTGNGYDDVIVGAIDFEETFDNDGRVSLYLTTAAGTATTPVWFYDGGQNDTRLGEAVAAADVNGDGLMDVIVGASDLSDGQVFEGVAYAFDGVPNGALGTVPSWTGQVDQSEAFFGFSLASVGDFNNDGYDDVIVGADGYDDPEPDEGAAFLYLGSPNGLPRTPTVTFQIDQPGANFGTAVAAGNFNGDPFSDVLIGAEDYTKNIGFEGGAFIFEGCNDLDRDGICQSSDNCPGTANPEQIDSDGDGLGDDCDGCGDIDADTICDAPQVIVEWQGAGEEVLVELGTVMKWYANISTLDPNFGTPWQLPGFNDVSWANGQYGVGFENSGGTGAGNLILTDTGAGKISIFTRADFTIDDLPAVESLWLGADYDDAYAAWINGVEVFRSKELPAGELVFNTPPDPDHESSNGTEPDYGIIRDVSITGLPALVQGPNTLAVAVWNSSPTSSDLVIVPRLSINRPTSSTMKYLAHSSDPGLGGEWRAQVYDDTDWLDGSFGIGFETALLPPDANDLLTVDVDSTVASIYTRTRFNVTPESINDVFIGADYDDGFVVWLNGSEIYRSPEMAGKGVNPAWNADPVEHESSNGTIPDYVTGMPDSELANITIPFGNVAIQPQNLLAIAAYRNLGAGADDFVMVPRLTINENNVDNCVGVFNPMQRDQDLDEIGDLCDDDIDGDGHLNENDNCPMVINDQTDSDFDGLGEACDTCPGDADNDVDGDIICAGVGFSAPKIDDGDNCPSVFNPDQDDTNGDGEGDACDPDIDGDGVLNGSDNCPFDTPASQSNSDGDPNGDLCDCSIGDNSVWEEPGGIDTLRFALDDVCFAFSCSESLGACAADSECNFDQCQTFECTESNGACAADSECNFDQCQAFECTESNGPCADDTECNSDVCASKFCTEGAQGACATDDDCNADFCTLKFCTESQDPPGQPKPCTIQDDCTGGPTDFCIGSCSIGLNPCASDLSCNVDFCQGTCALGLNLCTDDAQCTEPQTDLCRGSCSIGTNQCVADIECTQPQTDLCRGICSIGTNQCLTDVQCTQPQTDLCLGRCSLGENTCADDTPCTLPEAYTLVWEAPTPGAISFWFDTLRSGDATNFAFSTTCLQTGTNDLQAPAPSSPGVSNVFYYLVRTENGCPGGVGNIGEDSDGVARTGRACP